MLTKRTHKEKTNMTDTKYTPSFETLVKYALHELDDNRLTHGQTRKFLKETYNVTDTDIEAAFEAIN